MSATTNQRARRNPPSLLATPASRAATVPPGKRAPWQPLGNFGDGAAIGFRRASTPANPGQWLVRHPLPDGRYSTPTLAVADDLSPADGETVLSYRQALVAAARAVAACQEMERAAQQTGTQAGLSDLTTVRHACERYTASLEERGGRVAREARAAFKKWLGDLGDVRLVELTSTDTALFAERTPERVVTSAKAALNALPEAVRPSLAVLRAMNVKRPRRRRNGDDDDVIGDVPDDAEVARRVAAARKVSPAFGVFAATAAGTGARPGQLAMLRVRDLQRGPHGYHLNIAPSEKGQGSRAKRVARVPLSDDLAEELRALVAGRPRTDFLLVLPQRERVRLPKSLGWKIVGVRPWDRHDWVIAARQAGFGGEFYSFRHARICKLILAGVPLRMIAECLDTSTAMIEKSYSRWIASLGSEMLRI